MAFDLPWDRPLGRRGFLAGMIGLAGGTALGGAAAIRRLARTSAPQIALSAGAPFAFLSTLSTPQGTAFSVHVRGNEGASGSATFNNQRITLVPLDGYLVALFGAGQPAGDEQEIAPGDYTVHIEVTTTAGEPLSFDLPITISTTDFPVDAVTLPPDLDNLLDPNVVAQEAQQLAQIYGAQTPQQLWSGLWIMPAQGPISTQFGEARSYNGGPVTGHHSGVDIALDAGTPIAACAAGRVAFTGRLAERGNFIAIDHGLGVFSGYAHLSEIDAQPGQLVQPGDIIGKAGSTGLSTGPHLHWECAVNGMNVDALRWTRVLLP